MALTDGQVVVASGSRTVTSQNAGAVRAILGLNSGYDMLSELVAAVVTHTGAGTPTIGRWNVLAGSSEYKITLPTAVGHTGEVIGIRSGANGFPVRVSPYGGETLYSSVQGGSSFGWYFCGGNSGVFISDGVGWRAVAESREVGVECDISFTSSESSSDINKRIAALPRVVHNNLNFLFADGTYTITASIYLGFFSGSGRLQCFGNRSESQTTLHTNQAVVFDGSAFDGDVILTYMCSVSAVAFYNLAVASKSTVTYRSGVNFASCGANVILGGCYLYGNSTDFGFGCYPNNCPNVYLGATYFSNVRFGVYSVSSSVSLHGCSDTGTKPFVGVSNDRGVVSCLSSNCPGGSGAQFYDVGGGGAFLPLQESGLSLSDNSTADASTSKHGLCPKAVAPSSGLLNVLGIGNGETVRSNKAIFDTANPANLGTAAPGTSLIAARRDHVHAQGSAVADATGAGDVVAQLNSLLASLRSAGIIATQ